MLDHEARELSAAAALCNEGARLFAELHDVHGAREAERLLDEMRARLRFLDWQREDR